mmetsp:Transcript_17162/g.21051  ORF Transcript_17162/g.21051 Transcript_17162/m.21051 type:complete len:93 (-) Transcript_17162:222-500(-)
MTLVTSFLQSKHSMKNDESFRGTRTGISQTSEKTAVVFRFRTLLRGSRVTYAWVGRERKFLKPPKKRMRLCFDSGPFCEDRGDVCLGRWVSG